MTWNGGDNFGASSGPGIGDEAPDYGPECGACGGTVGDSGRCGLCEAAECERCHVWSPFVEDVPCGSGGATVPHHLCPACQRTEHTEALADAVFRALGMDGESWVSVATDANPQDDLWAKALEAKRGAGLSERSSK